MENQKQFWKTKTCENKNCQRNCCHKQKTNLKNMSKKIVKRSDKTVIKNTNIKNIKKAVKNKSKCEQKECQRNWQNCHKNNKYKIKWQRHKKLNKFKNGKQINIKMATNTKKIKMHKQQ